MQRALCFHKCILKLKLKVYEFHLFHLLNQIINPISRTVSVVDLDIDLLRELNEFGSVTNIRDRREDIYNVKRKRKRASNKDDSLD